MKPSGEIVALLLILCLLMGIGAGNQFYNRVLNPPPFFPGERVFIGDCRGFNVRAQNGTEEEVDWDWRVLGPGGPYSGGGSIPRGGQGKASEAWAVSEPLCGEYHVSALIEIEGFQESLHDSFACPCTTPTEIARLGGPPRLRAIQVGFRPVLTGKVR